MIMLHQAATNRGPLRAPSIISISICFHDRSIPGNLRISPPVNARRPLLELLPACPLLDLVRSSSSGPVVTYRHMQLPVYSRSPALGLESLISIVPYCASCGGWVRPRQKATGEQALGLIGHHAGKGTDIKDEGHEQSA